jgi:flagellar biosynthesis GTPase FlhF
MRFKVFSAPSLHEALARIRREMGPEALILDRRQTRDADGKSIWHVHAALDHASAAAPEGPQARPAQTPQNNIADATVKRLERIVKGLSSRETSSLRASLSNGREQVAFDYLISLGISASHAFDMASDFSSARAMGAKTIRWASRIDPEQGRNTLLFTGISGAGKTTMIAKLAAHYSMKGVRVAMLSTDCERIGGLEALAAYASTLGIPFFPLRQVAQVENIRSQIQTAQLMLIDSEGWSPRRDGGLKRQIRLWDAMDCTRRFMVLPANMDEEDGMQQLARLTTSKITDIAFSKLDETERPGKIVNWAITAGLPMSYCSFGPEVPEQMGWLTPQSLTTLLGRHNRKAST